MSKGRKTLMFKEVKYDFDNLLFLYCDSKKDEFKEGEVYNLDTGEDFDIKDLPKIYIEMNQGIIDASNHLTYTQKSRVKNILNYSINEFREKLLCGKLMKDEITKEELEEYIYIKDKRDIKKEFNDSNGVRADVITKFVKLNQEIPLPEEINLQTVGRYYRLLEVLIHKNKIFKKPHGNSKEPTKIELMDYLQCKSKSTFSSFISSLEKHNIARRFKLPNNRFIIFVNPLYAHKDLIISKELYNVFKDILEQKLDKRILRYMEFIYAESEISGSVVYTDK